MTNRFERLATLFDTARQLTDAAERETYIADACGADDALREELKALLAAHDEEERSPSAIEAPGLPVAMEDAWRVVARDGATPEVPGYRVIRRVGVGGMGAVYEAEQVEPRRRVALKLLRPEMASREGRGRFEREIQALARLQHPNLAQLLSAGACTTTSGASPYLALEFVDGDPIDVAAAGRPLAERVALVLQACDAVAHAHQRGIIHRDLKPSNVLVTREGQVKVLDFGLAILADESEEETRRHTRTGHLIGTLAYMSPEQALGRPDAMDTRCDVYGLGVLTYELLTGRLPHALDALPLEQALRVLLESQPDPAPELPTDLRVILGTALAKERDKRYDGVRAFANDLRRFLHDEPITARPPSTVYQLRKFVKRNRSPVLGAAATAVALVVGLVLALQAAGREADARARADLDAAEAQASASHASLLAAAADLRNKDANSARGHLASVASEHRDWEWQLLRSQLDKSVEHVPLPQGTGPAAPWVNSPDLPHPWKERLNRWRGGLRLHQQGGRGTPVVLEDVVSSKRVYLEHIIWLKTGPFMTPDGEHFLVSGAVDKTRGKFMLCLFPRRGGAPVWSLSVGGGLCAFMGFSPDGSAVALCVAAGHMQVRSVSDASLIWKNRVHRHQLTAVTYSEDGTRIATAGRDQLVMVWDAKHGHLLKELRGHKAPASRLVFSPDGTRLASGDLGGTIKVWDAVRGEPLLDLFGHESRIVGLSFGDSSNELHSLAQDGYRRWRTPSPSSMSLRHHTTAEQGNPYPYVYAVALSPDGTRIASCGWDDTVRIASARDGSLGTTIRTKSHLLDFGADGTLYTAAGLRAWDASTGEPLNDAMLGGGPMAIAHRLGRIVTRGAKGRGLRLLRLPDRTEASHWPNAIGKPEALAWSANGAWVAAVTRAGALEVYDARTGERRLQTTAHEPECWSVACHPSRPLVATGGSRGEIRLWDVTSGTLVRELRGHTGTVYALEFHPAGTRLASGSEDTSVRIWDFERGLEKLRLDVHEGYVKDLAFSADGHDLASASGDNSVHFWSTRVPDAHQETTGAHSSHGKPPARK